MGMVGRAAPERQRARRLAIFLVRGDQPVIPVRLDDARAPERTKVPAFFAVHVGIVCACR